MENVGPPGRLRLMYPTHPAAILSRQSRPEALSAATAFAAAFRHGCLLVSGAFTWSVALHVLMPRRVLFLELLRAVRLCRDRRELSGAAFGEGRVALLQMLDEVQAAHAVVKATAHGLTRADRLGRVGEANSHLVQVSDERAVVLVGGRLVEAGLGVRRHGKYEPQ